MPYILINQDNGLRVINWLVRRCEKSNTKSIGFDNDPWKIGIPKMKGYETINSDAHLNFVAKDDIYVGH